jgi:ribonuclease T2
MRRIFHSVLVPAAIILALGLSDASAQQRRQSEPGQFDFYVLALSWSPTFCEGLRERGRERTSEQCGERSYGFVVHGLWPQHERGYPASCQVPAPRLDRNIVASMLDLMPARRLVFQQWDRHGTCTGLPARGYFDLVRKARSTVNIPNQYSELKAPLTVSPEEVEAAFVAANPRLMRPAIAVSCDERRLRDVRICLSKSLEFRDCPEVERRSCSRNPIVMPAVRSSHAGAPGRAAVNQ